VEVLELDLALLAGLELVALAGLELVVALLLVLHLLSLGLWLVPKALH
jgi:hypothetical protein